MAVTPTPIFTQTPLLSQTQLTAANANRDGITGAYSTAISAGANGSLVDYIVFQATGTTAAGLLRVFYSSDSGATWRLLDEMPTLAITPSGTVPADRHIWIPPGGIPLPMPVNAQLKFNTNNAETWNVLAAGGNF